MSMGRLCRYFIYDGLPAHLQESGEAFFWLAHGMDGSGGASPERFADLRCHVASLAVFDTLELRAALTKITAAEAMHHDKRNNTNDSIRLILEARECVFRAIQPELQWQYDLDDKRAAILANQGDR